MTLIATAAVMSACCCNNNGKKAENCNSCPETKTECCETEKTECCETVCLEGKWTITSVAGKEIKLKEMPFIEFNLTEKKFHGNAGVNIMNGNFEFESNKLTFGHAATTMKAGLEPESTTERLILENLAKVAIAETSEKGIILKDTEENPLMELVK